MTELANTVAIITAHFWYPFNTLGMFLFLLQFLVIYNMI